MALSSLTVPVGAAAPVGRFRSDVQGLRAVAVTAVIADHLLGWPAGGFVGVDVFFVISGFLITGLLLRKYERDGRISWVDFYRRRARRILPAALLCLVVVVGAAFVVYRTTRAESVAVDAFFSMLFVANWHLANVGTDYLGAASPTSPLEHFWSLAVEEQFYLLWPLLLILILMIGRRTERSGWERTALLAAVVVGMTVGSFGFAVMETAGSPTWAYFSTLSRGWELAAGALLAVVADRFAHISPFIRSMLSISGLVMITMSVLMFDQRTAIPGPWSIVPVAGALLILSAGVDGQPRYCWLLTNRGSQYVGRISYSLYLWHFPVIVLLGALLATSPASVAITLFVIVALSVSSFHLIEEPFRRGGPFFARPWRPHSLTRGAVVGIALSITAAVVVTAAVGTRKPESAAAPAGSRDGGVVSADPAAQLSAELETALHADEWPELTPAIDGIAETGRPPKDRECAVGLAHHADSAVGDSAVGDGAEGDSAEGDSADGDSAYLTTGSEGSSTLGVFGAAADCVFGDPAAPKLAVVAGDSIGITWIPLIQELLESRGFRIQGLTMSGCPFVATETRNIAANIYAACPAHKGNVVTVIQQLKPDIVFISNTYRPWLADLPDNDSGAARYADGQLSMIGQFTDSVGEVVVLAPPPPGKDLADCATTVSSPADCVSTIPDDWRQFNSAMADRLSGTPRTTYLETSGWFCSAAGLCPSFVGHTPTKRDADGHVVPAFARRLAPLLDRALG